MVNYSYQIYIPTGNNTAIVLGTDYTNEEKCRINQAIKAKHDKVEQVGFVSTDIKNPVFCMAGGGFCGNGTRAAAFHFLNGNAGEIILSVPGISGNIHAGVSLKNNAWTDLPLQQTPTIRKTSDGFYIVQLQGITHLIIPENLATPYLQDPTHLKDAARDLLIKANLFSSCLCGAIFIEEKSPIRIHPFISDYLVEEFNPETACGTGTFAVTYLKAFIQNSSLIDFPVQQLSGEIITATAILDNGRLMKAQISGIVTTDNRIHLGVID